MDALRSDLAEAERRAFEHGEDAKRNAYLFERAQGEVERLESALDDARAWIQEVAGVAVEGEGLSDILLRQQEEIKSLRRAVYDISEETT